MTLAYFDKINELLEQGQPFVTVTIVDTAGSVPQDVGAKMIVDAGGRLFGTVGGGKVESRAIKEAQAMLLEADGNMPTAGIGNRTKFCSWNLQKDIGMTCGGSVSVYFEAQNWTRWQIVIFGAGHCAAALIPLLSKLDCSITCVDHRPEWLEKIPPSPRLKKIQVCEYVDYVAHLAPGNFVLLMTMGHSTDKPILLEIFKRYAAGLAIFPYLGVIGSKAKAHRLHMDIVEAGFEDKYPFFCPIGLPIGGNDPSEIAISVAAQLLEERDKLYVSEK
ncbi:MAG: XdhC family protein [Cyanobacteria bacterium SZAS LIN-3]|nr:XdhC family protein [Cyanobacteria bacterium SZAS LIN-3]